MAIVTVGDLLERAEQFKKRLKEHYAARLSSADRPR